MVCTSTTTTTTTAVRVRVRMGRSDVLEEAREERLAHARYGFEGHLGLDEGAGERRKVVLEGVRQGLEEVRGLSAHVLGDSGYIRVCLCARVQKIDAEFVECGRVYDVCEG